MEFLKNVKTMTSSQCLEFLNKKGIKVKFADYILEGTLVTRQNIEEDFGWHWPWPWHNMFLDGDKYKGINKLPESYGLFFYVFFCVSVWSEPLFYMDVWPDYGTKISRYGWIDCLRSWTHEWYPYEKSNIDEKDKQLLSNFLERSTFEDVIKSEALSNSYCSLRKPLWSEKDINKAINYIRWKKDDSYAYLSNLYMILDKEIAYLTTECEALSNQYCNRVEAETVRARHEAERDRANELNQRFLQSFVIGNIQGIELRNFYEYELFRYSYEFSYKDKPELNSSIVEDRISQYIENDKLICARLAKAIGKPELCQCARFESMTDEKSNLSTSSQTADVPVKQAATAKLSTEDNPLMTWLNDKEDKILKGIELPKAYDMFLGVCDKNCNLTCATTKFLEFLLENDFLSPIEGWYHHLKGLLDSTKRQIIERDKNQEKLVTNYMFDTSYEFKISKAVCEAQGPDEKECVNFIPTFFKKDKFNYEVFDNCFKDTRGKVLSIEKLQDSIRKSMRDKMKIGIIRKHIKMYQRELRCAVFK